MKQEHGPPGGALARVRGTNGPPAGLRRRPRTSIGSTRSSRLACRRVRATGLVPAIDRSRRQDQHPGAELDDRQDQTGDRSQGESQAADQEPRAAPATQARGGVSIVQGATAGEGRVVSP